MPGTFTAVDLSRLPFPAVVEPLDFEVIYAAMKAQFALLLPEYTAWLESDPAQKLLQQRLFGGGNALQVRIEHLGQHRRYLGRSALAGGRERELHHTPILRAARALHQALGHQAVDGARQGARIHLQLARQVGRAAVAEQQQLVQR